MRINRYFYSFLLTLLVILAPSERIIARQWQPDLLGDGYQMTRISHHEDYDGPVVSTIIRKLTADSAATGRGVLYVHGFNDYFFQKEMGDQFTEHGYDFYAVDLRRYGRSILPGQKPFDVRSLDSYFPDIDSCLSVMKQSGVKEIILMGHSTGGLTTAYFESRQHPAIIKALILNSPFLDWNLGWEEDLIPAISFIGKYFPSLEIKQGKSEAYAESLLKGRHGEWTYHTDWKMPQSAPVTAGWIRAITLAQDALRDGKARIMVPVLLMYSAKSVGGGEWTPEHNRADGVLDVAEIKRYGLMLGSNVTCCRVEGGLHDLMLSAPQVRRPLYRFIFNWLENKGL